MLKGRDLLASAAIHAAVFGAVALAGLRQRAPEQDEKIIPICFEVMEAAAIQESEGQARPESAPHNDEVTPAEEPTPEVMPEQAPDVEDEAVEEVSSEIPDQVKDEQAEAASEDDLSLEPVRQDVAFDHEEMEQEEPAEVAQEERAKVVSDPIALNRIVPTYPRSARRKGHEGRVTVEIAVADDGAVADVEVVASSGYAELDAAALGAARSARFAPATVDGVSVSGRLRLTFDFRLR
jgi:protein TonB